MVATILVRRTGTGSAEEDFGGLVEGRVEQLRLAQRFLEPDPDDVAGVQADHLAERAVGDGVHRRDAEARRQHAVVGDRRAAALDVAEDRHPALEPGPRLDVALELDRDATEPGVAEGVDLLLSRNLPA